MIKLNKVYLKDNLELMKEIEDKSIDLIYIDPPFYSKSNHKDFDDRWKDIEEYLAFMTIRIKEMYRILKDTGSFYLHCDHHCSHYLKILCDKIFGYSHFNSEIIWKRTLVSKTTSKSLGNNNDNILFYNKSKSFIFNQQKFKLTKEQIERDYKYIEKETNRKFSHNKLFGYIERNRTTELFFKDRKISIKSPKGYGFYWTQEYLDQKLEENPYCIYWTKNNIPRYKVYLDEHNGIPLDNIWFDIKPLSSNDSESLNYRTQKPESLLERIIKISSKEGDIVADLFCGSGTTLAVAKRLRREIIGCDKNPKAIKITKKRLKEINVFKNITSFMKND